MPSDERSVPTPDGAESALRAALRSPAGRAKLADALVAGLEAADEPRASHWWTRYRQFLAGLASGSVVVLAFLLPSIQDQWDRRELRQTIEQYAAIGRSLQNEGLYESAEGAFTKALELSDGHRIDLLEAQLSAHVERVNEDPAWRGDVPDSVTESDFIYLLELQGAPAKATERASTLAAFGVFLASNGRLPEAERRLRSALAVDPRNRSAQVNLGNLLAETGRLAEAEAHYRQALSLAPQDANASYDLAALLQDTGRCKEAEPLLRASLERDSSQSDTRALLAECLETMGRHDAAVAAEAGAPRGTTRATSKSTRRDSAGRPSP